jgi:hypothetical protein
MTRAEALRWATQMKTWGFTELQLVEQFPTGDLTIKGRNECGMPRSVGSLADFVELRETAEAGR